MSSEAEHILPSSDSELRECIDEVFKNQIRVVEANPKDGWAWVRLANLALKTGPRSEIVGAFESTVLHIGDSHLGWFLLGNLMVRIQLWRKAESAYRKAIQLERGDAALWTNLGGVFKIQGRYHAALRALLRAVEIDPEYTTAWFDLASVYSELGDHIQCRAALDRAYGSDPLSVTEYIRALEGETKSGPE